MVYTYNISHEASEFSLSYHGNVILICQELQEEKFKNCLSIKGDILVKKIKV